MLTQKFITSFLAPLPVVWTVAWHDVGFFSVLHFVCFFSPVMHIWTSLFCIDLDPAAGLLKIWAFLFLLYFGAGVGWVGWFFIFLFCCGCFFCFCFFFSLVSSSSVVHPPSKDRATPPVFASSCAAWTFGGWKIQSSPPHQVCVYFIIFLCHMASKETSSPHFRYNIGKWTATKSFLAIILFLALCRQPHSVSRKLCVKEWLLVSPPER